MKTNQQTELNFSQSPSQSCRVARKERRRTRAQWWFQQMRAAVDRAVDWKVVPAARPEQLYMGLSEEMRGTR
ncbi:MAG: hypothetical protein FJ405_18725 [Verrucomicrobia bacterium]|nr:hypothetical protein [Verrucomicrobiota bacterium]